MNNKRLIWVDSLKVLVNTVGCNGTCYTVLYERWRM